MNFKIWPSISSLIALSDHFFSLYTLLAKSKQVHYTHKKCMHCTREYFKVREQTLTMDFAPRRVGIFIELDTLSINDIYGRS